MPRRAHTTAQDAPNIQSGSNHGCAEYHKPDRNDDVILLLREFGRCHSSFRLPAPASVRQRAPVPAPLVSSCSFR